MASRNYPRKQRRKSWLGAYGVMVNVASLASGSQATVIDQAIEHPTSNQDYGPGTLSGLRLSASLFPAAVLTRTPRIVILLLPANKTVPTVNTQATLKENEMYVWGQVQFDRVGSAPSATLDVLQLKTVFKSRRTIEAGDRFVVVLTNDTGTAFGAGALGDWMVDLYVYEA